ncbi:FkbM family methyltransferase [Breoghania corrubedonensis]|uniref:FkbM family methyltransferase n=1 Tax=Breoghania corrubedonensis TaxID=665038 RepID=A0A2T5VD59_9HYPH|nr:FkbM family methyltransferase [Breoghania corrubedonensis]PTW61699.1 FkbM family methyltransferase [Breoghania corrubedonensis]
MPASTRDTAFRNDAFGTLRPGPFRRLVIGATRRLPEGWAGRRLALLLRRFGLAFLNHPLDVTVFGAAMRLHPFANVCERRVLFTPQFFDAEERALLAAHIRSDMVFVDIGANVGIYSLFVAGLVGPEARIVAVEPQPALYDRLMHNIAFNPRIPIEAVPVAVTDRDGAVRLFLDPHNEGQASIRFIMTSEMETIQINVPSRSLLSLLRAHGLSRVDAMKLDVTGAEDIILGRFLDEAPQALWPRVIIMENTPQRWQEDCVAMLKAHGWRVVQETRMNVFMEREDGVPVMEIEPESEPEMMKA